MTGQFDIENMDFKCLPSRSTLRSMLIEYAVDCLLLLSDKVAGKKIFMTCDKGNKKGLGHFVKVLSWWNPIQKKVEKFILDIDVSDGTSSACADAILHSMKKLNTTEMDFLLGGQTTDSGGGVLDDLAKELKKRDICEERYLVANCTLHAIQLALSNPVKNVFGEGGLDPKTKEPRRNMPQMLHSVYDLQESMEYSVFKMNHKEAAHWMEEQLKQSLPVQEFGPLTEAQTREAETNQFETDFNIMRQMATVVGEK